MNKKTDIIEDKPVFDKTILIAQAQSIFSTAPEVIAGALYEITKPITIEQARKKVEDFLTRPIEKGVK